MENGKTNFANEIAVPTPAIGHISAHTAHLERLGRQFPHHRDVVGVAIANYDMARRRC